MSSTPRGISYAEPLPSLHRSIGKTLRVHCQHLPWEMVRQLAARASWNEDRGMTPASTLPVQLFELDANSWRVDVTHSNVAAAQAQGWSELYRLLCIAQERGCEALELASENLALPGVFDLPILRWP